MRHSSSPVPATTLFYGLLKPDESRDPRVTGMSLITPVTRNLPQKPEDPENSKDPGTTGGSQSYSQIDQSDEHQKSIHYVPATLQVRMRAYEQTFGKNLQERLFWFERYSMWQSNLVLFPVFYVQKKYQFYVCMCSF